ncbi:hypothetical protein [Pseudooceanicola sp.]|uniref:hypothetical protein n=1 Tax=Pseudooceanicola sp. TaxID=1914328 RepID=UPI0035C74F34
MTVITDATTDWSAGVTLTVDEVWQNKRTTPLSLATGASAPGDDLDGVQLGPYDSLFLSAGVTVYYRKADSSSSLFTRTAVST